MTTLISVKSFRVDNKGLHCQENFNVLFVTELGRSKKIMIIWNQRIVKKKVKKYSFCLSLYFSFLICFRNFLWAWILSFGFPWSTHILCLYFASCIRGRTSGDAFHLGPCSLTILFGTAISSAFLSCFIRISSFTSEDVFGFIIDFKFLSSCW